MLPFDNDIPDAACDICDRPFHFCCENITTAEQRCLQLKSSRRLKFFRTDCENGLKVLPKVLRSITSLRSRISKLEDQIQHLRSAPTDIDTVLTTENIIGEISDRSTRAKHLTLYDVPEYTKTEVSDRILEDKSAAAEILNTIENCTSKITAVIRLGKASVGKKQTSAYCPR